MKKIIVFGDLPIATKVVMWIRSQVDLELVGVVIGQKNPHNNDPWTDVPLLCNYCEDNGIKMLTLEEVAEFGQGALDLGLSCRFSKILKPDVISRFNVGIINMHGGLLPDFAGLYSCNMSVLYNSPIGGGTLHFMDEGIDTGNIIRRCEFKMEDSDTGFTVFQKTQIALYENMIDVILPILNNSISTVSSEELVQQGYAKRYFNKQSIHELKLITEEDLKDGNKLSAKVRAFDFPGYEPAYMQVGDLKIYMRTSV